jgi:hypothetical protein
VPIEEEFALCLQCTHPVWNTPNDCVHSRLVYSGWSDVLCWAVSVAIKAVVVKGLILWCALCDAGWLARFEVLHFCYGVPDLMASNTVSLDDYLLILWRIIVPSSTDLPSNTVLHVKGLESEYLLSWHLTCGWPLSPIFGCEHYCLLPYYGQHLKVALTSWLVSVHQTLGAATLLYAAVGKLTPTSCDR